MICSKVLLPLASIALIVVSCRREEEDLSQAIDRRPCECSSQSADARGVEPAPVALSESQLFLSAAQAGNLSEVKSLAKNPKVDLMALDQNGKNALILAVLSGHIPVVEFLIEEHPELLSQTDRDGLTAREHALTSSRLDDQKRAAILKIFDGDSMSQEQLNSELLNILMESYDPDHHERLKTLLSRGADANARTNEEDEAAIPALFLSMGIRMSQTTGRLSLQADPVYHYAQALIDAGANREVTIVLRGREFSPPDLIKSPGAADRFAEDMTRWESLFQ